MNGFEVEMGSFSLSELESAKGVETVKELIGHYKFHSTYFGKIPFEIYEIGFDSNYPLQVRTYEFKGKKRIPVDTGYSESVIRGFIAQGKLVKCA